MKNIVVTRKLAALALASASILGAGALAGTAVAAPTDAASITLSPIAGSSLKGRDFTAYKLGDYANVVKNADGTAVNSFSVTTATGVEALAAQAATDAGIDVSAKNASQDTLNFVLSGSESGSVTAAQFRAFANALAKGLVGADATVGGDDPVVAAKTVKADDTTIAKDGTLNLDLTEGYYLIVENQDGGKVLNDDGTFASGLPIALGTTFQDNGKGLQLSKDYKGYALGSAVVKSNTIPVVKTANADSAKVGDDVTFTARTAFPNLLDTKTFYISDTASNGFTAPADTDSFTVSIDGKAVSDDVKATVLGKVQLGKKAALNAAKDGVDITDDANSWAMVLNAADFKTDGTDALFNAANAGKSLEISYTVQKTGGDDQDATVAKNSVDAGNIYNEGQVPSEGHGEKKVNSFDFDVDKTAVDGTTPVFGAAFKIASHDTTDTSTAPTDTWLVRAADGKWSNAADEAGATTFLSGDTDYDGTVSDAEAKAKKASIDFAGLAAGTYTVKEETPAAGYSNAALPTFTVTIADDGTVTIANGGTLVSNKNDVVTVKNIRNLGELAQTGGIGVIIATLIAAIIATGAVVVIRRGVKNAKAEAAALRA
ncbi:collagen-binding protein [Bifidobacterium sp. DSM 109959]|uniref:Collagen-binding protein n=2 Tax=Bifidobacterium olomucense TaxID=2675324 RepID=A0A7Y0EW81_9BIFI|nr:collagen-binding protein [Bifidobacterium sp. DSM 109959]